MQGGRSHLKPRFRLFLNEILLCLPNSAWAGGNRAEWADHLGSNGGNKPNVSQQRTVYEVTDHLVVGEYLRYRMILQLSESCIFLLHLVE